MKILIKLVIQVCILLCGGCADDKNDPANVPDTPQEVPNFGKIETLHIEGKYLKNPEGKTINLHGFAQTYSPYFNQNEWTNYDVTGCLKYNKQIIDDVLSAGWKMNFVRMHMDPYWSDDPNKESVRYEGHERFLQSRFEKYLEAVFIPMAEYAISKGIYVVMRPPGVCPEKIAVGDNYNTYLELVWNIVSKNDKIKNNPGIMFELANEPRDILSTDGNTYGSNGQGCFDNMKIFCQRIVDKIRANGATNMIWVPGLAYQSSYSGFAKNPVAGQNIGYAVHVYPGWFGSDAEQPSAELGGVMGGGYEGFQRGWNAQVQPIADISPVMITEMDWAPAKYDSSWGKSITGTVGATGFGANFKYLADNAGNVSWLLFTDCSLLARFKETPGSPGSYTFLNDPEACPWPVYHWFKEYADETTSEDELISIETVGGYSSCQILTGSDKYVVLKAVYKNGAKKVVTSGLTFTSSDASTIMIDKNGRLVALKDGEVSVNISYASSKGVVRDITIKVTSTTFPLTNAIFNPSIWEKGTFREATKTLVTGLYGFGGWQYANGVNLSAFKYLTVELGNDNECSASFRLFDKNNYWSEPASYDFGRSRKVVVDLNNMYTSSKRKTDLSHLYIIGIWSTGNKPIIIDKVYLSN